MDKLADFDFSAYTKRYLERMVRSHLEVTPSLLWQIVKKHLRKEKIKQGYVIKDYSLCSEDDATIFSASFIQYYVKNFYVKRVGFATLELTICIRLSDYDPTLTADIIVILKKDDMSKSTLRVVEEQKQQIITLLLKLGGTAMLMDFKRLNKNF